MGSLSRALASATRRRRSGCPAHVVGACSGRWRRRDRDHAGYRSGRVAPGAARWITRCPPEVVAPLGKEGPRTVSLAASRSYATCTRRPVEACGRCTASRSPIGRRACRDDQPAEHRRYLESRDWAARSFADRARALERAWRFVGATAVRLQRSRFERLPSGDGWSSRGTIGGADAVEVGGDWYDAVRRPDGPSICVGDVSARNRGGDGDESPAPRSRSPRHLCRPRSSTDAAALDGEK